MLRETRLAPLRRQLDRLLLDPGRVVVMVGGESGAGKSTLAAVLARHLDVLGAACRVLHLDDYFHQTPRANHAQRMADLASVGVAEVDLAALQHAVDEFRDGALRLTTRRLDRAAGVFRAAPIDLEQVRALLVEGTYALRLAGAGLRVFVDGDFLETETRRRQRARDPIDPFSQRVLAIEHELLREDRSLADLVVRV